MKKAVYLDHQATTPVDARVLEAMLPYFSEHFGNAASKAHAYGWTAEGAVAEARELVRKALGAADPAEIVFTSGATESNNLALHGAALAYATGDTGSRGHIITTAIEHRAILEPIAALAQAGFEVTYLALPPSGIVEPAALERAFRPNTILVSVMAANNEVGTIQPLKALGELCRERSVVFHTDAAQALGQLPLDVNAMGLGLVSLSAHKFYGPKGVGALYVRRGQNPVRLAPMVLGGGHELGLRAGTLNVPGIVGLGCAAALALREADTENARVLALRERLWNRLSRSLGEVLINGDAHVRLAGNLNLLIRGVRADVLMAELPLLAMSSGSACSSADPGPSHVLRALGLSEEEAACSIRLGLGRFTSEDEVDFSAERLERAVRRLRAPL